MFPKRVQSYTPEGYPDLTVRLWSNPTGAALRALEPGWVSDQTEAIAEADEALRPVLEEAQRARLEVGAAFVASYDAGRFEAYGMVFDFSTPEAAMRTLDDPAIPDDLRYWLRMAPIMVARAESERLGKLPPSSWMRTGTRSTG